MRRRVVVTGMGIVSPIGIGLSNFWGNLLNGQTGVRRITRFNPETFPTKIACEVTDFEPSDHLTDRETKMYSRITQFALAATKMAISDSRIAHLDPYRTNVIFGSGVSGFDVIDESLLNSPVSIDTYLPHNVDPLNAVKAVIHAPAIAISLYAKCRAYTTTVASACSSGLNSVGLSYERIQDGRADIAIAGGGDTPISLLLWGAFCAARMFTSEYAIPEKVLRPYDKNRTKGTLAEGAAVFILEEANHALSRGAKIYGEINNYSQSSDNVNELFMAEKSADTWAETIVRALQNDNETIDYISAHGPSDRHVDQMEYDALRKALPESYQRTPISSIKAAIGSGMATAGALQLASALMALKTGKIPPQLNYESPDEKCRMSFVTKPMQKKINKVLVNAKAIGGVNSSLVLKRFAL